MPVRLLCCSSGALVQRFPDRPKEDEETMTVVAGSILIGLWRVEDPQECGTWPFDFRKVVSIGPQLGYLKCQTVFWKVKQRTFASGVE